MKDEILLLRSQKKTYLQIATILGCAKSTVAYHCSAEQKRKTARRVEKYRKDKLKTKYSTFKYDVRGVNNKFTGFKRKATGDCDFSLEDVKLLIEVTDKCYLCGNYIDYQDPSSFHFDHVIPTSRGGLNTLSNLKIACKECNFAKRDIPLDQFLLLCERITKYHSPVEELVNSSDFESDVSRFES